MMVVRPVAAVFSAVLAGLLAGLAKEEAPVETAAPCCETSCCGGKGESETPPGLIGGLRYAATDIYRDVAPWLAIGLGVTGLLAALVPPGALAEWASGPVAMIAMLGIGIPLYVCATASTPIAAGLLAVGVSPGTVLVFLLAGPATNLATLGVVGRDLGKGALMGYLAGIALGALAMGLATDALVAWGGFDVTSQIAQAGEVLPTWVETATGIALLLPLVPVVARWVGGLLLKGHSWKH